MCILIGRDTPLHPTNYNSNCMPQWQQFGGGVILLKTCEYINLQSTYFHVCNYLFILSKNCLKATDGNIL